MLTQQWASTASLSPWQCNELRWVLLHWSIPIAIPRITAATQTCLNTCTNIGFLLVLYTTLSCGLSCILVLDNLVESQFICTHSCSYCEDLKVSCLPWLPNCSIQWQLVFRQRWYGHVKSSCWGVDDKCVLVHGTHLVVKWVVDVHKNTCAFANSAELLPLDPLKHGLPFLLTA